MDRDHGHAACDRRDFLRGLGAAGACAALTPATLLAAAADGDPYGVLVDTTCCVGCQTCTRVCAEGHGLPAPEPGCRASTGERQLCCVSATATTDARVDTGVVFVKRQCMHCLQPACASACLTCAMHKTADGPVVWDRSKCMGCRYCMVSCPFDMPKFEYDRAVPEIRKCDLCIDELQQGRPPRCVANCGNQALTFGRRGELLTEAHKRLLAGDVPYQPRIYGEREAGGTSWLYLAALPFEQLGFPPEIETQSYPALTKEFLYGVPVVLTLVPPLLLGISKACGERAGHGAGGSHG